MAKIKQFFKNILAVIGSFFAMIGKYIGKGLSWFFNTKVMKKIVNALLYFPRKLDSKLRNDQRKAVWGIIFVIPLVIGFVYFFFIPFILTFQYSMSFSKTFVFGEGTDAVQQFKNIWVGFSNYQYIFKDFSITINYEDYIFLELLLEAFVEIITDLPIILIFSLIMAVVLNSKFTGRTFVRAVFFMPVIFNSQAIDLAVAARSAMTNAINANTQQIFDNMFSFKDFLLNANLPAFAVNFLGDASNKIYDIISYSGIQILIFLSAIQSVPRQLYEAAKMEGATQYEMFWKITFPMVSPMLLTSAVYTIVDSYTRSPMIKALTKYATAGTVKVSEAPGLTGKALELYNIYSGNTLEDGNWLTEFNELSKYGVGAGLSLIYALMVILIIVIVLGVLSKAVFYYDK